MDSCDFHPLIRFDASWWFPHRQPLRHSEARPIRYCPPHFLSPILSPPKKRREFLQWWRMAAPLMGFVDTKNFRCSLNSWLENPELWMVFTRKNVDVVWLYYMLVYGRVTKRKNWKNEKKIDGRKSSGGFKNRWYHTFVSLVSKKRLQLWISFGLPATFPPTIMVKAENEACKTEIDRRSSLVRVSEIVSGLALGSSHHLVCS